MSNDPFTIDVASLASQIGRDGFSIVDASWYLPAQKRFARPEYEAGHIPGAVFFDQDAVVAAGAALPHTLPDARRFADAMSSLGVAETDTIVVYDGMGLFSAARVWWMLRTFGARDVRVLDAGFPAWRDAGQPVETGPGHPVVGKRFEARFDPTAVADLDAVRTVVAGHGNAQIVDARSAERFRGEAPEPRAGVRSGHMSGARSLPFSELVADGRLKDADALRAAFEAAQIDLSRPVVTSCGSGVTAAVVNLALARLGAADTQLDDGSWTEWGSQDDTPVRTGPAT